VSLVRETGAVLISQWSAIRSIAAKVGCTSETLRRWVRQTEIDDGERAGLTSDEKALLKQLQRENGEFKQAKSPAQGIGVFAQTELDS
jgi:transposase